jgi:hypothetical protein
MIADYYRIQKGQECLGESGLIDDYMFGESDPENRPYVQYLMDELGQISGGTIWEIPKGDDYEKWLKDRNLIHGTFPSKSTMNLTSCRTD